MVSSRSPYHITDSPLMMKIAVSWPSCMCAFARSPGWIVNRTMQMPLDPALSAEMPPA